MRRRSHPPQFALLLGVVISVGCGATHGGSGDAGANGGAGGSNQPAQLGDAFGAFADGAVVQRPEIDDPGNAACAMQTLKADRLPLDLLIMMDSSGSMTDLVAPNRTKWDAVKEALSSFFADPESAGIGVGLHYFPQLQSNVPEQCMVTPECNGFGPCNVISTCEAGDEVVPCNTNMDCGPNDRCVPLGFCSLSDFFCIPVGGPCGGGPMGTPRGNTCVALGGYCEQRDKCDAPSYSAPAVAVAELPGAAPQLNQSLDNRALDGLTPTAPALEGVIENARMRAMDNNQRRVAVVLATDGFPTTCDPIDIDQISGIALGGATMSPSVSTFVVGVFTPEDQVAATGNLNRVARAGGTDLAFMVTTNQDVTQAFLGALNTIRGQALGCEYAIPEAEQGQQLNYFEVNVRFTDAGGDGETLGYVGSAADCNDLQGGWYYDVDPLTQTPSTITACPSTCDRITDQSGAQIDIVLGCSTYIIE